MKTKQIKSKKVVKHRFKVGDVVGVKLWSNLTFYGRVKKLLVQGSANQPAYEISGFGDSVYENVRMFKARRSKVLKLRSVKVLISMFFVFMSASGFAQLLNPGDTTGTLITASIRPNSQADDIATVYANEARGTIHHYQTWSELLAMKPSRLVQYQLATLADSAGKVYQYDGISWGKFNPDLNFTDLSDTPNSYSPNNLVKANSSSTGIEFSGITDEPTVLKIPKLIEQTGLAGSVYIGELAGGAAKNWNDYNIALGYRAMYSNESTYSIGIGYMAGYNSDDTQSIAIGYNALKGSNKGAFNIAIGAEALEVNSTGYENIGIGRYALDSNTSGYENVAVGYDAGQSNSTGRSNSYFGFEAGHYSTKDNNVFVGFQSGKTIGFSTANSSPSNSTYIGARTFSGSVSSINEIVIGYFTDGKGSNTVSIGNSDVTNFYLSEDAGATIHGGKFLGTVAITDTDQLTTKEYVDNTIGAIPSVDLSNYLPLDMDTDIEGYNYFINGFDATYVYGEFIDADTLSSIRTLLGDYLYIENLPLYTDNSAAKVGGMLENEVYKTPTGKLEVVLYEHEYEPEIIISEQNISAEFDSGSSVAVDFSVYEAVKLNLSHIAVDFSFHNVSNTKSRVVSFFITGYGFDSSLTFPAEIKWLGTKPTTINPSENGILTFQNFGDSTGDIVASYVIIN